MRKDCYCLTILPFEQTQVPIVPGKITKGLTRKLNEFYIEFKSFSENSSANTFVLVLAESIMKTYHVAYVKVKILAFFFFFIVHLTTLRTPSEDFQCLNTLCVEVFKFVRPDTFIQHLKLKSNYNGQLISPILLAMGVYLSRDTCFPLPSAITVWLMAILPKNSGNLQNTQAAVAHIKPQETTHVSLLQNVLSVGKVIILAIPIGVLKAYA